MWIGAEHRQPPNEIGDSQRLLGMVNSVAYPAAHTTVRDDMLIM